MALSTEKRRANYRAQRQGGLLTAKQRRRIRKAENKANSPNAGLHVTRIRKRYDRQRVLVLRQNARGLIAAIRSGQLKPSYQARLRAELEAAQAAESQALVAALEGDESALKDAEEPK